MTTNSCSIDVLLGSVETKLKEQAAIDDPDDLVLQKAATSNALHSLLECVSQTPKEELPDRSHLDNALVSHAAALKWPLVNALKKCSLHRAFLGLAKTMEQTRRFLTTVSVKKMNEILKELDESLDTASCKEALQWVEQVLVYMTGAGKFKKELAGFELKGANKQSIKAAINRVKKRGEKQVTTKGPTKVRDCFIATDVRIDDRDREAARVSAMDAMVDQALCSGKN
jgi:hypothetical protein